VVVPTGAVARDVVTRDYANVRDVSPGRPAPDRRSRSGAAERDRVDCGERRLRAPRLPIRITMRSSRRSAPMARCSRLRSWKPTGAP
jgi:hypothetical protein